MERVLSSIRVVSHVSLKPHPPEHKNELNLIINHRIRKLSRILPLIPTLNDLSSLLRHVQVQSINTTNFERVTPQ